MSERDQSAGQPLRTLPYRVKPSFDFGWVFAQTFKGFFRNIGPITLCSAVVIIFSTGLFGLFLSLETVIPFLSMKNETVAALVLMLAYGVFAATFAIVHAFSLDVSYSEILRERIPFKTALIRSLHFAFPIVLLGAVFWAAYFLGMMLLVIPGLIISAGWAVVGPAYMFETMSFWSSFTLSWELTKGYKFLVWLMNLLVGWLVYFGAIIVGALMFLPFASVFGDESASEPSMPLMLVFAFMFQLLLMLYSSFYGTMKAAIYDECQRLQIEWERNLRQFEIERSQLSASED